jgi:hypothetical protein
MTCGLCGNDGIQSRIGKTLGVLICKSCVTEAWDEVAILDRQLQRLIRRRIPRREAVRMMERRIDRYYRNGTLTPFPGRGIH